MLYGTNCMEGAAFFHSRTCPETSVTQEQEPDILKLRRFRQHLIPILETASHPGPIQGLIPVLDVSPSTEDCICKEQTGNSEVFINAVNRTDTKVKLKSFIKHI